ncbi:Dps family protein [Actinacidiphila acididurans]|uniref:DNA starvation/stationary phase protection protein n=1 Tax=Actinacidiphila acididurans TaxID=2784346 RepID=A0ABS2TW27_9ACTN|nr:DNA starvation/stationary phase protection protein [Actinacidiphila acididurans]MBM9507166.1 DNA starvation/stationary phase protection protein [Actinacidiphila acididurans]
MTVVKSPLSEDSRKIVADALQSALVDLIDLSLIGKQVHWNIIGPRFRSIHLQLDEVVGYARSASDLVAERAAALGITPDGRAGTVARTTGIDTVTDGWVKDAEVVEIMVGALHSVITRMRERVTTTEEPDPVTQDLLIGITRELEKEHWMFQAENA